MGSAVAELLSSLDEAQRRVATYRFDDAERHRFQYTPGARGGLALADMAPHQRDLALRLLDEWLSTEGARTARAIMGLEPVLRELERRSGRAGWQRRDPGHYWFAVFGDPRGTEPWAWRVGGHHLCLHFTVVGGGTAVTPLFLGANPARVPEGPHAGLRVLSQEEDLARRLLTVLDPAQRSAAVVSDDAPRDILTTNRVRADIAAVPTGIEYAALRPEQQDALADLVAHYLGRVRRPPRVSLDGVGFAWAGGTEPGQGHYYALRSDTFLVEYDNTQNGANHVHTVWRDARADWGEDLLAAHYARHHG